MNVRALILLLLVLAIFFGFPMWGFHHYGWGPSGGIGAIVVLLIVLALLGII